MRELWKMYTKKADFQAIANRWQVDPVVARVMRNRGLETTADFYEYLQGSLDDLADPTLLKDAEKSAVLIETAIAKGEKIGIASDFDNDGIFSAMVLYEGILELGGRAAIYTPHRILEGYGLNDRIVDQAAAEGCRMILTCDNGIAAFEAVKHAKESGFTVIITDHHEIPFVLEDGKKRFILPEADAIVDAWQADDAYPYKKLCGTGVCYRLMDLLFKRAGKPKEEVYRFLEYTAIATVADVMELNGENRILVKEGLKRLHQTKNPGLTALIEACELAKESISSYHIGFILGPCFNAAGRLDTVRCALDLLQAADVESAKPLAKNLRNLNEERKLMTNEGVEQAMALIEEAPWKEDPIYLVYLQNCHESVAGIIAGRIRERHNRPTLVFCDAVENGLIKASGRSIEAWNMFDGLSACKDLFERFGGHAMAAGLTMKKENLPLLRSRLMANCTLTKEDLRPVVWLDCPLPITYVSEKLIADLELLEPFGRGNEKPLFAWQHVDLRRMRRIGKSQNMLKLELYDGTRMIDALYFGDADEFCAFLADEYGPAAVDTATAGRGRFDLAVTYYPQVNDYRGFRTLQIVVQNYCRIQRNPV